MRRACWFVFLCSGPMFNCTWHPNTHSTAPSVSAMDRVKPPSFAEVAANGRHTLSLLFLHAQRSSTGPDLWTKELLRFTCECTIKRNSLVTAQRLKWGGIKSEPEISPACDSLKDYKDFASSKLQRKPALPTKQHPSALAQCAHVKKNPKN